MFNCFDSMFDHFNIMFDHFNNTFKEFDKVFDSSELKPKSRMYKKTTRSPDGSHKTTTITIIKRK